MLNAHSDVISHGLIHIVMEKCFGVVFCNVFFLVLSILHLAYTCFVESFQIANDALFQTFVGKVDFVMDKSMNSTMLMNFCCHLLNTFASLFVYTQRVFN